jgi:hypothetical protein
MFERCPSVDDSWRCYPKGERTLISRIATTGADSENPEHIPAFFVPSNGIAIAQVTAAPDS